MASVMEHGFLALTGGSFSKSLCLISRAANTKVDFRKAELLKGADDSAIEQSPIRVGTANLASAKFLTAKCSGTDREKFNSYCDDVVSILDKKIHKNWK